MLSQPSSVTLRKSASAWTRLGGDTPTQGPPAFRHAKLLANIFHVSNQLSAIVTAQAPFEVNSHLEKNIANYAAAILLSTKISAYKGSIPTNILLNMLKKHRFDLPAGIENNPADYARLFLLRRMPSPNFAPNARRPNVRTEGSKSPSSCGARKRTKLLGANYSHTLVAMHNLALTYGSLEQFEEAEKLQAVVLDNWRKFLGDDHLLTLAILGDSSPIGCSNYANKMLGPSQMGVARYRGGRIEPLQIRLRSSSRYQEPREHFEEGVNLW
ncbi:hypothetical protein B0H14DRAFT_2577462 [Mycena olivaceomarginata]|nr:hypothetical protein B0H14DRAFT_2577462 [Mycena olivaceomarginata]